MADDQAAKVARDAAVQSLVSNVVYLALMLGITLAIAKRDELKRLRMRLERAMRHDDTDTATRKAVNEFRREISQIEHWMNRRDRGPEMPGDTGGGLYG